MAAIITGAKGMLVYWGGAQASVRDNQTITVPDIAQSCSFARLSAFAANSNHAPTGCDGAVTWDAGVNMLFRIAGAR